jgi:glutamate formiminotransferase/formiminotetrahydrofolate cyclodeaminase
VIEYLLKDAKESVFINKTLEAFCDETASESPAPGGGSVSAAVGALGVSLGTMVANLSSHKRGWDDRWKEFSDVAEKGQHYKNLLLKAVDADTLAFNKIMDAFSLPKNSDEEKSIRKNAIESATIHAIKVPFQVMQYAYESMEVMKEMVINGNPNSVTDAGVGALCARTAVIGAHLNVLINAADLKENAEVKAILTEAENIKNKTIALESEILKMTLEKI